MVFRLYSEVLWYPGRQLNIMNMLQGSSMGNTAASASASSSTSSMSTVASSSADAPPPAPSSANKFSSIFSGLKKDKEEPRVLDYRYTATHLHSAVYCRSVLLCFVLTFPINPRTAAVSSRFKALEGSNGLPKDVVEPPKFITGKHVAAIFEKLGFDSSCGQKVFGVLCEAVNRADDGTGDALIEGDEEQGDEDGPGMCMLCIVPDLAMCCTLTMLSCCY